MRMSFLKGMLALGALATGMTRASAPALIETDEAAIAAGHRCAVAIQAARKFPLLTPTFDFSADKLARDAFLQCLGDYVRIPTLTPAAEGRAVRFLATIFGDLGIPTHTFATPGRNGDPARHPNLVATLTPDRATNYDWSRSPERPSVVLLNHVDVVDVAPQQWESPDLAFSGELAPSRTDPFGPLYLWGRGSLDMKGIGMLQLFCVALLKQQSWEWTHDIHFLAVSDEERNSSGAVGALRLAHPGGELVALTSDRVTLGEGGMGITGAVGARTVIQLVNNEEKGGAWLDLRHGSYAVLLRSLERLKLLGGIDKIRPGRNPGRCELVAAETAKAKVNVVTSEVTLTFRCASVPDAADVASRFAVPSSGITAEMTPVPGGLRLRLQSPTSAHGALAHGETLLEAMAQGLVRLGLYRPTNTRWPAFYEYEKTPATRELLDVVGAKYSQGEIFQTHHYYLPWLGFAGAVVPEALLGKVGAAFYSEGLFRTTCTWSAFELGSEARALVDCRLVRPPQASRFVAEASKLVAPAQVSVLSGWDFSRSPTTDPSYGIIKRELERESRPARIVAVAPWLAPNGSDNTFFRNPRAELGAWAGGVPTYGLFPIVVPSSLVSTQHGSNERFPVSEMTPGLRRYFRVLRALASR